MKINWIYHSKTISTFWIVPQTRSNIQRVIPSNSGTLQHEEVRSDLITSTLTTLDCENCILVYKCIIVYVFTWNCNLYAGAKKSAFPHWWFSRSCALRSEAKDLLNESALSLLVGFLAKSVRNELPKDNSKWAKTRRTYVIRTLEKMITSDDRVVAALLKLDILSFSQKHWTPRAKHTLQSKYTKQRNYAQRSRACGHSHRMRTHCSSWLVMHLLSKVRLIRLRL